MSYITELWFLMYSISLLPSFTLEMEYIGLTDNPFKTRLNEQNSTFRNENMMKSTTIDSYVWDNILSPEPTADWSI